jgi:hypothetical protein
MNEVKNDGMSSQQEKDFIHYEEAMKILKEGTGIGSISEVVTKFQKQSETYSQLLALKEENDSRFEELRQRVTEANKELAEMKVLCDGKRRHVQRIISELNENLESATTRNQDSKMRNEKSSKLLSEMKIGVQHLLNRLTGIQPVSNCLLSRILKIRWKKSTRWRFQIKLYPKHCRFA